MKYIGQYEELIPGRGYEKLLDNCEDRSYPGMGKIIYYLRHGRKDMVAMELAKDVFTGEVIPGGNIGMNDGQYSWCTYLAYYVEKYNLRLPEEFEKHILHQESL